MYRNLLSLLYELDMNGTYLNFDCGHTVVSVQRVGQSSNLKHSVVILAVAVSWLSVVHARRIVGLFRLRLEIFRTGLQTRIMQLVCPRISTRMVIY